MNCKLLSCQKKQQCFLILSVSLFFTAATAQNYAWVNNYGSGSNEAGQHLAVAPDGANYCIVSADGPTAFGSEVFSEAGAKSMLVRHNAGGGLSWAEEFGGATVSAIEATNDHVYLACNYSGSGANVAGHALAASGGGDDAAVVRVTKAGVPDLVFTISGIGTDNINDLDVDENGNIYVTGRSSDSATYAGDPVNEVGMPMFVAKFSANGVSQWVVKCTSSRGYRITTDKAANRIFVASIVESQQIISFSNSSFTFTEPDNEYGSIFLCSFDPAGTLLKTKVVTGKFRRWINTLDAPETNSFYLMLEEMYDSPSIWKFDDDLNQLWRVDGPIGIFNDHVSHLAADLSGNFYLTGTAYNSFSINGTKFGDHHAPILSSFIVKYSTEGSILWVTGIEAKAPETDENGGIIRGIDTDDLNDPYVTGRVRGTVNFMNHGDYTSAVGTDDFFVARLEGLSDYESVAEHDASALKLFPSVNDGNFVVIPGNGTGRLLIRDVSGRTVFSQPISGPETHRVSCNLREGIYMVTLLNSDNSSQQSRIVVSGR